DRLLAARLSRDQGADSGEAGLRLIARCRRARVARLARLLAEDTCRPRAVGRRGRVYRTVAFCACPARPAGPRQRRVLHDLRAYRRTSPLPLRQPARSLRALGGRGGRPRIGARPPAATRREPKSEREKSAK